MVEELNQMAMRLRYLEEQAQGLEANIQIIQSTIDSFQATLMTLGNLKEAKPNQDMMVKIGNNSYLKAKIEDPNKIIVGVGLGFGTDVYVEKSLDDARENINERIEEVKKAQNLIQNNFNQLMQQINAIRPEFEKRYAEFQHELAHQQGIPHND